MHKFLYHPVKPYRLNQDFGGNPTYYAKFGWKGHNGLDLFAPHATSLYSPCDGIAYYAEDSHGGAGIYIRIQDDNRNWNVILWHLCTKDDPKYHPIIPSVGFSPVKAGQLIGYTDNSGAPYESSGDHLHLGLMPCDGTWQPLSPKNGYGGCVDPSPFLNGIFAEDIPALDAALEKSKAAVDLIVSSPLANQTKASLLQEIKNFLIWLFKGR